MRILVVAATEEEVGPFISDFRSSISELRKSDDRGKKSEIEDSFENIELFSANCQLLITGVGMVATAFAMGMHLASNHYGLAINLGIAGSFDKNIALGEVLEITRDTFAELGAEDNDEFLPMEKMGFGGGTWYPGAKLSNLFNNCNLQAATAITVNTVHGNAASIKKVAGRLNPQLESMEGAAFFYACNKMNVPCLQIRAVSNYVEKRNRDSWQIGLAIKNLNTFAVEFLKLYA